MLQSFCHDGKRGQRFTATKYGILVFGKRRLFLGGVFVHSADVGISGAVIKLMISTYRFSVAQFYWKIVAVSHGQVFSVGAGFVWLNPVLEFRGGDYFSRVIGCSGCNVLGVSAAHACLIGCGW